MVDNPAKYGSVSTRAGGDRGVVAVLKRGDTDAEGVADLDEHVGRGQRVDVRLGCVGVPGRCKVLVL